MEQQQQKKSVKEFDRDKCTESRIEEGVSIRKEKRAARLDRRRDRPPPPTAAAGGGGIQIDESFLLLLKENVSQAVQVACQNIGAAAGNSPETIAKGLDQILCLVNRDATTHPLDVAFRNIPAEETCKRLVGLMSTFEEAFRPYVLKICNIFLEIVTQYNPQVLTFQAQWDQVMMNTGFFDCAVKHITAAAAGGGGSAIAERLVHVVLVFMDLHPMNAQKMLQRYRVQEWITKTSPEYMAWYLYVVMHQKKPVHPYENIMTSDLWNFWMHTLKTQQPDNPVFQDALCAANHCARRPSVAKAIVEAVPFERWMQLFTGAADEFLRQQQQDDDCWLLQQVTCMLAIAAEEKDAGRVMDACAKYFYKLVPRFSTGNFMTRCMMHIFYSYVSISADKVKQFVQNGFLTNVAERLAANDIHRQEYNTVVKFLLGIVSTCLQHTVKSVGTANSITVYNMFFGTPTLIQGMLQQLSSSSGNPEHMLTALRVLSTALSWEKLLGYRFIHNQIEDDDKWDFIEDLSYKHDNVDVQLAAQEVIDTRAKDHARNNHEMDLSE